MNMAAILWKFKLFDVALIWLQFVIYAPELVELDYFYPFLFVFWPLFITCQNFAEICKYVRLTVCLFVCLLHGTGRSFWPISTKLGPHMESGPTQVPILFIGQRSNN